jgi:hypothetical protein
MEIEGLGLSPGQPRPQITLVWHLVLGVLARPQSTPSCSAFAFRDCGANADLQRMLHRPHIAALPESDADACAQGPRVKVRRKVFPHQAC